VPVVEGPAYSGDTKRADAAERAPQEYEVEGATREDEANEAFAVVDTIIDQGPIDLHARKPAPWQVPSGESATSENPTVRVTRFMYVRCDSGFGHCRNTNAGGAWIWAFATENRLDRPVPLGLRWVSLS
jgi:hypothetical protein